MNRLEHEMARRLELIEALSAMADMRFLVMVEGPVRAQVPMTKALDHVPTHILTMLVARYRSAAAQDLLSIARLHPSQLVDWRPGDVIEELRDDDEIGIGRRINVREYGLKRLLSQPEDGASAAAARLDGADGEGGPDGKVAEMADGGFEVGGSAGHDVILSFVAGAPSIQWER